MNAFGKRCLAEKAVEIFLFQIAEGIRFGTEIFFKKGRRHGGKL
ncbi:MAG: hypothetical protein V8Q32_06435 [Anaerotignum faecicola]